MFTATLRIRVEWSHCDAAGIIFNPHYYVWMDAGTHAMIHAAGFDLAGEIRDDKLFRGFPLVASHMDFNRPLYFGDITVLTTRVEKFGNSSFVVAHDYHCGDNPEPVATGRETRVWGYTTAENPDKLRARPMPDTLKAALSQDKTVDTSV